MNATHPAAADYAAAVADIARIRMSPAMQAGIAAGWTGEVMSDEAWQAYCDACAAMDEAVARRDAARAALAVASPILYA